jgi:radical SAM protein with 4Fe4S-binding SPASM domain
VPWTDDDLVTYERSLEEVAEWYVEMRRHDAPLRVSVFDDEDRSNGWGCGAGRGRLSVTASGDIYGCSKLVTVNGLEREGLYRYGDVFRGVIDWKQRAELVDGSGARRTECVPCAYRDECSGGCPAVNYEARGSAFLPDRFFCALVPITSRVQARVRNELASGEQPDASGVEDVSCRAATDHTESSLSDLDTGNGVRGRSVESSLPMEV